MVGTPPAPLIRSRSISCIANSVSHLRMSTSFPPLATEGFRIAKQPVAWKNGTESNVQRCGSLGLGIGGISPRRR
jgi:hypothetical protein